MGLIIIKCGSETGYGARFCGSFPHQKQAGETVLSLTNGLRGFGKEFEETLSQKGFLKNRSPLNPIYRSSYSNSRQIWSFGKNKIGAPALRQVRRWFLFYLRELFLQCSREPYNSDLSPLLSACAESCRRLYVALGVGFTLPRFPRPFPPRSRFQAVSFSFSS